MAVKKTTPKASAATKAAPKKAAPKAAAPKAAAAAPKAAAPKAAAPKAATAAKTATPKAAAAAPKKPAPAPKKKAAPIKLTDKQLELLKRVNESKEGYLAGKGEAKGLESLQTKKLIKRGAKDKTSGNYRFTVSKTGEKHLATPAPSA